MERRVSGAAGRGEAAVGSGRIKVGCTVGEACANVKGGFLPDRLLGVVNYVSVTLADIQVFTNVPKIVWESVMEGGDMEVLVLPEADHGLGRDCFSFAVPKVSIMG